MVPPAPIQPTESETVAFGPWMLVEKLQRRHAHVLVDDMGVRVDNDALRSRGVMELVVVPRQQGKLNVGAKQQRAVPVRKPLTIYYFPIISKPNPKVGSSRVASRKSNTVLLEKSRHSAVEISKNSNPNCLGLPPNIRCIIMDCVTSSSIQVQWNGTRPYDPSCGGNGVVETFSFHLEWLPLSHLFFVDDLILYAKVGIHQAEVINAILSEFGTYSGHKVSCRKKSIFFSPNTDIALQQSISSRLGFQRVDCLGKYMGVPVLHRRSHRTDYSFILEKMRAWLSGWASKSLSMAGRITLAKFVLSAIPIYFMQSSMLPKSVCLDIERIVRAFIWGSTNQKRRVSIVN
ncbi:hypothetical protein GQ457_13G013490 [Hibiscus cannabinus]